MQLEWRKGVPQTKKHPTNPTPAPGGLNKVQVTKLAVASKSPTASTPSGLPSISVTKKPPPKPVTQQVALDIENCMAETAVVKIVFHMPDKSRVEKKCPGSVRWTNLVDYCSEHLRGKDSNYQIPKNVTLTRKTNVSALLVSQSMLQQKICECISREAKAVHLQVQCKHG